MGGFYSPSFPPNGRAAIVSRFTLSLPLSPPCTPVCAGPFSPRTLSHPSPLLPALLHYAGPFSPRAELANGRAAMLGFVVLYYLEYNAGAPFF